MENLLKEISKSLNIHSQTLYLWIKKYNLKYSK